jgi:hypothetical protein
MTCRAEHVSVRVRVRDTRSERAYRAPARDSRRAMQSSTGTRGGWYQQQQFTANSQPGRARQQAHSA